MEADIGPIEVAIYNLGAQIGNRALSDTSDRAFEMGWRLGTFGLFRLAKSVCPLMVDRGRGNAHRHLRHRRRARQRRPAFPRRRHGGRRLLCQTLNAELSPKNIHVAHVVVDGSVDAPDTLGKMLGPERFQALRETKGAEDGLMLPEHIADTYYHISEQHRSVWTHELDLRSFSDLPWWKPLTTVV